MLRHLTDLLHLRRQEDQNQHAECGKPHRGQEIQKDSAQESIPAFPTTKAERNEKSRTDPHARHIRIPLDLAAHDRAFLLVYPTAQHQNILLDDCRGLERDAPAERDDFVIHAPGNLYVTAKDDDIVPNVRLRFQHHIAAERDDVLRHARAGENARTAAEQHDAARRLVRTHERAPAKANVIVTTIVGESRRCREHQQRQQHQHTQPAFHFEPPT